MQITPYTSPDFHPKDNHCIIENLPVFIKQGCKQFNDPKEQELFLMAALGVLSGCLPNYLGNYDGPWLSPHLYFFFLARYGTGKGMIAFARYLAESIHLNKRKRTNAAMAEYNKTRAKTRKKKGDTANSESADIPLPPNEMLYIPADNSKSALIDTLNDNRGCGIIFETEGDTQRAALGLDYAAFLDVLLKAFHHEPLTFQRRQGREYKEVTEPRLAIVMSSTYDQFIKLVPSAENGLVSRFAYYMLQPDKGFKNVFSGERKYLKDNFVSMGQVVELKYNALHQLHKPIFFHFTANQEEFFNSMFDKAKSEAAIELGGSINRLGVICFRIAMILAYFRHFDRSSDHKPPEAVYCEDIDFTNAVAITSVLHENMETLHTLLPPTGKAKTPGNMQALFEALPDEFETKKAVEIAAKLCIGSRSAERYLKKDERLENVSHGKYKKKK